ncbi:hypothetical protein AM1_5465 [Acaryochloris marina MBIC11017]|uniref:Uncharacterized protein n=1 Tax=Acaryochloris marina (strain MBIC 11017) TaxID=329726 RepID=B0CCX8_ACAM1|nr:hypothetical protein AM1_5465 [Acaryochloris marina MBIC11017]
MRLKDDLNGLRRNLTTIIEGIKGITEGLMAVGATLPLAAFASFTVFVDLWMTT